MTNDDDSAVLLPCPFCGGVQIKAFHHIDRGWGASWHVECVAEECGNSTYHHDTEAAAIAVWNKRQPTQSDALRDQLLQECLVKLRDVQGTAAPKQYACNLIKRIERVLHGQSK